MITLSVELVELSVKKRLSRFANIRMVNSAKINLSELD
jgi:hypothetical protein